MCTLARLSTGYWACAETICSFGFVLQKGGWFWVHWFPQLLFIFLLIMGKLGKKEGWRETKLGSECSQRNVCRLSLCKNVHLSTKEKKDRLFHSSLARHSSRQNDQSKSNLVQILTKDFILTARWRALQTGLSCCKTSLSVKSEHSDLEKPCY